MNEDESPSREAGAPPSSRDAAEPRERTSKGERSRQRLIDATAALLRKQGFHGTGLAEIVQTSGAPRGSLYFYFPGGKEELACAALAESGAALRQLLGQVIDAAGDVASAVEQVCQHLAASLAASGWEQGCPLATVALEASSASPQVRETCAAHFNAWIELISERLIRAGVAPEQARQFATFGLAAIEGALLLSKVQRDPQPLHTTGAMLRQLVAMRTGDGSLAG
jgi:TetR/AcrR family transcriptional regulator, lmrAB and yxaGH operons repressor